MLKKFFAEFKEFALKGNVIDLAVGVIIGAAFKGIVDAFTADFIQPLINCIGGAQIGGCVQIGSTGEYINYGDFITQIINFLIMAVAIFLMVKAINKLSSIGKKKEEPAAPLTRKCPYCFGEIDKKATKCMHCTADVTPEE